MTTERVGARLWTVVFAFGCVGFAAAQDTALEWPVEAMPSGEVWLDESQPYAGNPYYGESTEWNYGDPGLQGEGAMACWQLWDAQPWQDYQNIGDADRSVAVLVNEPVTVTTLGIGVGLGQNTNITVTIRQVIGAVRQGTVLASASKDFAPSGVIFQNIPINFTFLPGIRYDIAFEGVPGWGFNINTMRLMDFNNPTLDPNGGFDAGPFRVLDGGAGGSYSNTLTPFALVCDVACPGNVDLRAQATFDQSSFERPNTVLYAQSLEACNQYLTEVRVQGTHTSGNDVTFNVIITGARLDTGGMGAAPNFSDIRWTSFRQRFPAGGGLTEVTVNPNIGVNVGQTYFIVLDSFSYPSSGVGTVRATPFNGPSDLYENGEFVFANLSGENSLQDFNAKTFGHRAGSKQDLGIRAIFTAGEAPRPNVIDFQALEHHDNLTADHGAFYDEEGYRIAKAQGDTFNLSSFGTQNNRYPQSTAMFNNTVNGTMILTRNNSAAFDMLEIKLAELNGANPAPVNFTGFKRGGGTVAHGVNLDGIGPQNGLQRFVMPNTFTDLVRVEWKQESPFHQFDDIVVRAAQGVNCNLIGKFVNKCKRAKMTSKIKSSLPLGTVLTIDNNGVQHQMTIDARGKGKIKIPGQANIAHRMTVLECPARTCVVADCNGTKCRG